MERIMSGSISKATVALTDTLFGQADAESTGLA